MRNIALRIQYDGTDFVGSQWQANGRSVQGELEGAWEQLTQERRKFVLAGRTDAGVHALGQVANIRSETERDRETIFRGMNAILPEDVAVAEVWEAPWAFHARHDATRRSYRYLIDNQSAATPLLRRQAVHIPYQLDVVAIGQALVVLIGRHDFAAFAAAGQEGPTVRTCYAASCQREVLLGQEVVVIDIAANGFLHHMVRNIVGTLMLVGVGKLNADGFAAILRGRDRRKAGRTAQAHGLCLMSVSYSRLDAARDEE